MGEFERDEDHGDVTLCLEELTGSLGIEEDVELSSGGPVASPYGSSHKHNLTDFFLDLWELPEQQTQVGQRACVCPNNL